MSKLDDIIEPYDIDINVGVHKAFRRQLVELIQGADPDFAEDIRYIWTGNGLIEEKKKWHDDRVAEHQKLVAEL